jgi:hypothetical protein
MIAGACDHCHTSAYDIELRNGFVYCGDPSPAMP